MNERVVSYKHRVSLLGYFLELESVDLVLKESLEAIGVRCNISSAGNLQIGYNPKSIKSLIARVRAETGRVLVPTCDV